MDGQEINAFGDFAGLAPDDAGALCSRSNPMLHLPWPNCPPPPGPGRYRGVFSDDPAPSPPDGPWVAGSGAYAAGIGGGESRRARLAARAESRGWPRLARDGNILSALLCH